MAISVAIVDDDLIMTEGIQVLLGQADGITCVATCSSAEEALVRLPSLKPDVVLMDIELPGISGVDCVRQLKPLLPQTEIMMLTIFGDNDQVYQSLQAGASGYLIKPKTSSELLQSIQELHAGGSPMSPAIARKVVKAFRAGPETLSRREEEVLQGLARGHLYKEIAEDLGISYHTVRTHIRKIYEKLQVQSRAQAILKYWHTGPSQNRP